MDYNKIFNIEVFSLIENDSFPNFILGRGRIFYKGENRNATYISEEFAEKLLSTAPYSPLKGIFEKDIQDFLGHSRDEEDREKEIVYGIIPANPNVHLEKQLDEDGVEREYYCVDILLFSGVYGKEKISTIIGKKLSMEIIPESIRVIDRYVNGKLYKEFTEGSLKGLQILGDRIEPCFEGAGVDKYSLNTIREIYELLLKEEEQSRMLKTIEFKYTPQQKEIADKISAINADYMYIPNEAENLVWSYSAKTFSNFEEQADGTYKFYDPKTEKDVKELEEKIENYEKQVEELEGKLEEKVSKEDYAALVAEKEALEEKLAEQKEKEPVEEISKEDFELLKAEKEALEEKLAEYETAEIEKELIEKEKLVAGFEKTLGEKVNPFKEKISEYSLEELDKELTYLMVKETNQNDFSYNYKGAGKMDEEEENSSEYGDLISAYKNNKKGGK